MDDQALGQDTRADEAVEASAADDDDDVAATLMLPKFSLSAIIEERESSALILVMHVCYNGFGLLF